MDMTPYIRVNDQGEVEIATTGLKSLVSVTDPVLRKWKERGLDQVERGWWNLARIIAFFRNGEHIKKEIEKDIDAQDPDYRLKTAKANLAELEYAKRRGEFFAKDEIHAEWASRCTEVRTALLNLCRTLPLECAGMSAEQVESVVKTYVEAILEDFARGNPETPEGPGSVE